MIDGCRLRPSGQRLHGPAAGAERTPLPGAGEGGSNGLAYTVGYEHGQVAIDGVRQPEKLRVTLIYRRDGEWKLVHRHGDFTPVDQSPTG